MLVMRMKRARIHTASVPARWSSFLGDQLRKAKRELALSPPGVHEARKAIKKLRAGLRLAKKMFPKSDLQKIERPLRRAAHLLGPLRDRKVLQRTVARLRRQDEAVPPEAKISTSRAWRLHARQELENAGMHFDSLSWTGIKNKAWRAGLQRLYRRGRKAMREADSSRTNQTLHTWRKRTKDFYYALCLLKKDEIPGGASLLKKTNHLTQYLGDDHDLAFFEARYAARKASHKPFFTRAKKRRDRLQKKAFHLGRHVYCRRPRKFI